MEVVDIDLLSAMICMVVRLCADGDGGIPKGDGCRTRANKPGQTFRDASGLDEGEKGGRKREMVQTVSSCKKYSLQPIANTRL